MSRVVSEITFVGMSPRSPKDGKPAPSALNMPGWKMISEALHDAVKASGIPVKDVLEDRTHLTRQYIYSMMNGTCNPSIDKVETVMRAVGMSLETWLNDKALYGRDKKIHDQVQLILNNKGTNAITLRNVIAGLLKLSGEESET